MITNYRSYHFEISKRPANFFFLLAFAALTMTNVFAQQKLDSRSFDIPPTVKSESSSSNNNSSNPSRKEIPAGNQTPDSNDSKNKKNGSIGCQSSDDLPLKSTNSNVSNIHLFINLDCNNRVYCGIRLAEEQITKEIYTPNALTYPLKMDRVELIEGDTIPIRQIKAPNTFADVVVISRWEYELRFYHLEDLGPKSGGLYTFTDKPYVTYKIRNPNPPNLNRLEIIMDNNGTEEINEYFYDVAQDLWQLTTNGEVVATKYSTVNPDKPCERIETRFEKRDGERVKIIKIYRLFPWGQEIVKEIEDPDGKALKTTYTYYEDSKKPKYTFLKTITHPDGRIENKNQ